MLGDFFQKRRDHTADAVTLISALCTVSRNELLKALDRNLPPSTLAITFAIASSRTRDWLSDNSVTINQEKLREKAEELWLIEGLAGFGTLHKKEIDNGRSYFRSMVLKVDAAIDEIMIAEMNPMEALKHIRNTLGPDGDLLDDDRIGPPLLKSALKIWLSVPESCSKVFK